MDECMRGLRLRELCRLAQNDTVGGGHTQELTWSLLPLNFTFSSLHHLRRKQISVRFGYGIGENSWESLGLPRDPTSPSWRRSILNIHWKDWCWSWNSNTLAIWCKELTHLKRPWSWERLKAGGEGDNRGWDGWMASPTQWRWVWVNSGSW